MKDRMLSKVVLVTGASAGMGRAAAERLGAEGAAVVLASRDKDRGEEVAQRIREAGGQSLFVRTDVTVEDDVAAAVDAAVSTFGRLDGAFNNAGGGETRASVHSMGSAEWRDTLALNLDSVYFSLKYEVPAMLASGGGSIVNNASVGAVVGHESMHAYTAAKHAVVGLTRSTALQYSRQGVRINAVAPGIIRTSMLDRGLEEFPEQMARLTEKIPAGRIGEEGDIAALISFVLSDDASYVTGAVLAIDGAMTAGLTE